MRFVTSLDFDGQVKSKRWPLVRDFPSIGCASVYDTVNATYDTFGSSRLVREQCILGVGVDDFAHVGVSVCLTKKTALLHKYVAFVSTYEGEPTPEFPDGASCTLWGGIVFSWISGRDVCTITFTDDAVQAFGHCGSVIMRSETAYDDKPKLMTLYDLLVTLCHETHRNLLQYKTIRLYSGAKNITTTIRLHDTVEANRFFTKMRLEMAGHREY